MGQLVTPEVPTMREIPARQILSNAVIKSGSGEIFYLCVVGNRRVSFPVQEDGTIPETGGWLLNDEEMIKPVLLQDLGVTEIRGNKLIFKKKDEDQ